ncbi:MAG: hypothetical protein Q9167_003199 [Letrouitia subvulpina]
MRKRIMRRNQLLYLLGLAFLVALTLSRLRSPAQIPPIDSNNDAPLLPKPLSPATGNSHPIHQLMFTAQKDFEESKLKQSQTLSQAVREYYRRYRLPPPPNFDKWYEFAKEKGVQLIDEYDTIYHSLLPFWALEPSVIRGRAREALGFDNALLGLLIRDGRIISAAGGTEWQQKSTVGMVDSFVKHLPDMDLPFNVHDEPRVIVPHDDLTRLVATAKDRALPAAFTNPSPKNLWSPRPADVDDGTKHNEVKSTRFNRFAHQPTWTNSRASCSPESPARGLDDTLHDDSSSFAFTDLGFVSNKTAFSDICLSPSLRERFGFFDRPNAYNIVHDLFPIFSQSKISSYQDILYPSPWYWSDKVPYNRDQDSLWENKYNQLFWRGSTTGGFSRDGGWRRQHRQRIVGKINALDSVKVFDNHGPSNTTTDWALKEVPRADYKHLFDVKFSHVGQCDPDDCNAQKDHFDIVNPSKQHDAWGYKYLLDLDGNAFSGRFYAFLKSNSLIYKMAIFREWHEEWIRPWVHYIPLSLKGDEYVEIVRYFDQEELGKSQASRIALQGQEWAGQALRNEDLEVWLFRLLLE